MNLREDAISIFQSAVKAVHPENLMSDILNVGTEHISIDGVAYPIDSFENLYVIGAGKAAAAMAQGVENHLDGLITEGLVVTKHGHKLPTKRIKVLEAGHPLPDTDGSEAMRQLMELLRNVGPSDLILCLISGGASTIWCDVPSSITLEELQKTVQLLLNSGANIKEINTVRKHLSLIKGGQLLKYTQGAKIISLILSDVPDDDLSVVASGPTHTDLSTFSEALEILDKYQLTEKVPNSILNHLKIGRDGLVEETVKPDSTVLENSRNVLIGSNHLALKAAKQQAEKLGYHTLLNENIVTGNTEIEAIQFCRNLFKSNQDRTLCLLQGGETTLKVTGGGMGGRNQHFALTAAQHLKKKISSQPEFCLLSGGSDGTDGPTNAAGGIVDEHTFKKAKNKKLDPFRYLENFDSYNFLKETDSLFLTGPTQTNVMDFMIGLITKKH